jgi:DNA polymerase-3 subunit alpha
MSKFVHLHCHTEYSLLDGLSNIKKLISHVKEQGMDSLAITDHGVMYGEIEFYKEALKQGIKPILGMEGYITAGDLKDRPERGRTQNYHLLLLAKNNEGYQNLMKLASVAHLDGYYYRPRFDRETLKKYSKGLICTSACPLGEVGQSLINGEFNEAKRTVEWYLDTFKDDYYLEFQRHEHEKWVGKAENQEIKTTLLNLVETEKTWGDGIVKISREMGVPIVATNDAHYIRKDDALAQDALVCISTGKTMSETKRLRYIDTQTFYVRSPDEMQSLFPDFPDAIENTVKIAEKCDVEITLGKWFFPKFPLPSGVTADDQLKNLAREKLVEKIQKPTKEVKERLEYELEIIIKKGYSPYFLIVMDLANWARESRIITNTRGSAAGSLVSFVLGITTVNPIDYYLPFERFLNPYRPSPPDIDFDVADDRREEIIGYITQKYGREKVAQVCTFGRMLSRAAVRDVARVLGYPYSVGDRIAKMIPPPKQGFPITITKAMNEVPELKSAYENDPDTKKVLDLAMQVEGNARHISVHAAGVVVAPTDITDFSPVQKEPSGEKIITQYEMHAAEDVGLIKFDILGIRNLSILGAAIDIVEKTRNVQVDLHKIPINDKKTFEMLARGDTMGVFQMAGGGMTKYIKELKPNRVEDLMAMVALYRPGPISQIPEYIKRKNNPKLVKYLDPRMEKFLGMSYGLIVYQDDLLFCALDLAGYTWEEADKFRKAVGKKIPEEMAAQKDKFTKGIVENGRSQDFAEELWKLFEPFQSYGFNKAHAASYGIVAYQTAYMKANYPVEYMTALLTAESNDKEKISAAVNECRRVGINVLPPDINESEIGFTIVSDKDSLGGKGIRFGFSAIKNVGEAAINAILTARSDGEFTSFSNFLSRSDGRRVNKRVLESLIKVGALGRFGSRAALLASVDSIRDKVAKPKNDDNQQGLFATGDLKKTESSQIITVENIQEFGDDELESLERQLLGFSLSAKPISEIVGPLEFQSTHKIFEINTTDFYDEIVRVAAVVTEVRVITTKKSGAEMAFAKVDDGTGTIELVVFPKIFKSTRDFWTEGNPLLIFGKVDTRDETPALLVESIETLSSLNEKKQREVFIKIPKSADANVLKRLKTLFTANLGDQTAYLMFESVAPGGTKKIKLPFKISWNETLAKEISAILDHLEAI